MTNDHYILKNKKLFKIKVWSGSKINKIELLKWAKWFEDFKNRQVKRTVVGKYYVSTVFLGLDHNFGKGKPLVFETMAFHNKESTAKWPKGRTYKYHKSLDNCMDRYSTWNEAVKGHAKIVNQIKKLK